MEMTSLTVVQTKTMYSVVASTMTNNVKLLVVAFLADGLATRFLIVMTIVTSLAMQQRFGVINAGFIFTDARLKKTKISCIDILLQTQQDAIT